jgi:NIMA (never in mitosis gene a)-related kinase
MSITGTAPGKLAIPFTNEDSYIGAGLSDFKIHSELGRGSYGIIYKVESNINHQIYVMKKISMKHMKPKHQKEALQEVLILKKMSHPNIIKYYSSFIEEETLYIIMEYAAGGDLFDV